MAELPEHETGGLTQENNIEHSEQEQPQTQERTTLESPAPPKVISKPQPESSSEEEDEDGTADVRSPVEGQQNVNTQSIFEDYGDTNQEDTAIFNTTTTFTQGGEAPLGAPFVEDSSETHPPPQESPQSDVFANTGYTAKDETDLFGAWGAETSNESALTSGVEEQSDPEAATQAPVEAPHSAIEQSDLSQANNQPAESGPSFFDEPGEYDGGDFFSSTSTVQHNVSSVVEKQLTTDVDGSDFFSSTATVQHDEASLEQTTTEVAQSAASGKYYGGEAATTTTAISEIFDSTDSLEEADFFANPTQPQSSTQQESSPTQKEPTSEDIAAKWQAALAADEMLNDDFLPDDDDGFLSSEEEDEEAADEKPSQELKPIMGSSGQLMGFSNVTIPGAPITSNIKYTPPSLTPATPQIPNQQVQSSYGAQNNRYQPQSNQYAPPQTRATPSPYVPSAPQVSAYTPANANAGYYPQTAAQGPSQQYGMLPKHAPPAAAAPKPQSFVDKKGGYQSPYDLPMDVVKPVLSKRVSMPQMSPSLVSPPPRQSSIGAALTPPLNQSAFPPPSNKQASTTGPPPTGPQAASKTPKAAFFEELPMPKTRPSGKYAPPPAQQAGLGMARSGSLPGQTLKSFSSSAAGAYQPPPPGPSLGPAPSLGSKYAAAAPPAPPAPSRFAPPPSSVAPPQPSPAVPPTPPSTSHYSSATVRATLPPNTALMSPPHVPPHQRPPSAPLPSTGTENRHAHNSAAELQKTPPSQRQVSAPLNFAMDGNGDPHTSLQYATNQPRHLEQHHLHSSRPGTAKSSNFATGFGVLKEEDEATESGVPSTAQAVSARYNQRATATPPPPQGPAMKRVGTFSPPSRSASPSISSPYTPQYSNRTDSPEPLRRARTQSPSTVMNGPNTRVTSQYHPQKQVPRPASALAGSGHSTFSPVEGHTRGMSTGIKSFMNDPANFMPPQDPSVRDPLNRWQGCPIFSWGFGGHVVMMFPTRTQRGTVGMAQPMIKCSPGEVKIKSVKEVLPLEENFLKFPGPVYSGGKGNKAKKKEVLTWMGEKISSMESEISDSAIPIPGEIITEADKKKKEEKILLWKGMKTLLENDGILEGVEIEKQIRQFLWPSVSPTPSTESFSLVNSINSSPPDNNSIGPVPDRVDPDAMKTIRLHLLNGDRTSAVWHAVDKRLWSHAMLIAGTVSQDLWKQVVQDFVRNEVKTLGGGTETLAVLYEVFAGNGEESVDELVPQSARLGQPMTTTSFGAGVVSAKDPLEGLEKWKETLALIVSNRSVGDHTAIIALGKLLAGYSRVEAAHLCYLFARNVLVFSGSDDPNVMVSLFGADHTYSPYDYWRDADALLLSEIYELALSLAPAATSPPIIPHLQGLKLYHALTLAENGYRTEAQKYCEAIASVLKSSTKPSPYFHRTLFNTLEDFTTRVSQSPKDAAAGGWLSKLSQDNISGSMWGAFTKFVAGEDNESVASTGDGASATGGVDPGPYGKMGPSPGISRSQSTADMYGPYSASGLAAPNNYSPTTNKTARYDAPTTAGLYSPYSPQQQTHGYAPRTPGVGNGYEPVANHYDTQYAAKSNAYKPTPLQQQSQPSPYTPAVPTPYMLGRYEPSPAKSSFESPAPYKASFESPAPTQSTFEDAGSSNSYQPPSYGGYAPPTDDSPYAPPEPEPADAEGKDSDSEGKSKPKKKSFMDDEDDDAELVARAAALKKEQEEKKKEEEEEAKKAAAASKGGWFSGWFGKKDPNASSGPIKAKLGEESSFVYDPELKRWINKKAAPESAAAGAKGTPPPPKRGPPSRPGTAGPQQSPTSTTGTPPPAKSASVPPAMNTSFPPPSSATSNDAPSTPVSTRPPPLMRAGTPATPSNAPPSRMGTPGPGTPGTPASVNSAPTSHPAPSGPGAGGPPQASAPPSRPSTAAASSGGDILDDLLGTPSGSLRRAAGGAGKKGRKGGRYVDVMAK